MKTKKNILQIYNILLLLILLMSFSISIENQKLFKFSEVNYDSEIVITIKEKGDQRILNNRVNSGVDKSYINSNYVFNIKPSEIIVNGNKEEKIDFVIKNLPNQENTIIIKFNQTIFDCNFMFAYTKITKIDFTKFDSSQVNNTEFMFRGCASLESINFCNFNTSSVIYMNGMFSGSYQLRSLDLSNFNTTSVVSIFFMFSGCSALTSLDLSSFKTSSIKTMREVFRDCSKLISLNLSNFDTSSVTDMSLMFYGCSNLISLDVSNFNTLNVTRMDQMFYSCSKLISLDLSNFNTTFLESFNIFNDVQNLITCINNDDYHLNKLVKSRTLKFNNCSHICFYKNKKIIIENKLCSLNCDDINKFDYKNLCYKSCPSGTHNTTDNICIDDIYANCNIGNNNSSLNYLEDNSKDINTNIISSFYNSDYSEYIENNNTQLSYIADNTKDFNTNVISTFYNSDYLEYINNNTSLSHMVDSSKDINTNFISINYNSNYSGYFDNKDNINKIYDLLTYLRNEVINNTLFIMNLIKNNKKDFFLRENNAIGEITSTYNQYNNEYINISNILFGECETILRKHYNISNDTTLLIIKIDIFEEGFLIPIIEYELYDSKTKTRLNLTICKDSKISINIPVSIDENNLFKYNSSHEYYNDKCYPYTTQYKTDIILKDRRNEFIKKNLSLCENNCDYEGYDIKSKKAKCECSIKIELPILSEIIINQDKLLKKFINIKSSINIEIIKCYKNVFTKGGLLHNLGFYIMSIIILLSFILSVLFKIKGYNNLENLINDIIKKTSNIKDKNNPTKKRRKLKGAKKVKKAKTINILKTNDDKSESKLNFNKINLTSNIIQNINHYNIKKNDKNNISVNKFMIDYNDYELNNLSYNDAIKEDKRNYLQYYCSLLKTKHLLIFTFYTFSDYNSKIIKIILFLFFFSLYFSVNALFFNDSTMHKIYEDLGKFNFIYQLPNILYSTIITSVITIIIKYLSLSEKNILQLKNENRGNNKKNKKEKQTPGVSKSIFKNLKRKFIIFFILCFFLLFCFWFYLSCFCAIYYNTQIHLIKDTLTSFGLSLVYPFFLNLLPGLFRIPALKTSNKELMYKVSKIMQLI